MFGFLKKLIEVSDLTEQEQKWNKLWDLWAEGEIPSPYSELMTYQSEINNGGHSQYFTNSESAGDITGELKALFNVLPGEFKENLNIAYKAYIRLEENEDEEGGKVLERCDDFFFENEEEINSILERYSTEKILL